MYGLQKGNVMIYNIGLECGARFCDKVCNSYLITGNKNIIIDAVPKEYENEFISAIEKHVPVSEIDSLFLLSVLPQCAGTVERLLKLSNDITIRSTTAGVRNLSEITEFDFKSSLCKNGVEITIGNYIFVPYITPNIISPDTMILHEKEDGNVFSGELFSADLDIESYIKTTLSPYASYISSALEIIKRVEPSGIYPRYGMCENVSTAVCEYENFLEKEKSDEFVAIAYSSRTGNNKAIASFAADELEKSGQKTKIYCLDEGNMADEAARKLNSSLGLVLRLPTENRSMPRPVWDFLSQIEVNSVSGKPYFVFSSCGWSNEGAYMANEILSMLKMRKVCKAEECVFTPMADDFRNVERCISSLADFISKQKEKIINA